METRSNTSNSRLARLSSHARIGSVVTRLRFLLPAAVAIAITACGGGSDTNTHLRGVNLVSDSPTLEFTVDGVDVSSASYGNMTPITAAHPGTHALQVAGVNASNLVTQPTATFTPFGTPVSEGLAQGVGYTVVAYGTVSAPKLLVVSDPNLINAVPDNTVIYQIIDAAPKGPPVDVYITAPEAGINAPSKVGSLRFGESTAGIALPIPIPAGILNPSATLTVNFTIELRDPTTGADIVPPNTLTLSEQTRALFVIADNIGPGSTPIVLDALVGQTGAGAMGLQFANLADDAELAFANVTATAPPFNIIGGLNLQSTLATNIGFGQKSGYGNVNAGVAGTIAAPTADPTHLTFLVSFSSSPDQSYTEYAVGPLAMISGVVIQDDRRTVPVQGEFRFLNAAYSLQFGPAVDIYLTPHGTALDISASNGNRPPPNNPAIVFKGSTAYQQVVAGTYDVYFANTGTSDIVLGPIALTIANGTISTYVFTNAVSGTLELLHFNDGR
jgi:uncharacterized protein DUF4397